MTLVGNDRTGFCYPAYHRLAVSNAVDILNRIFAYVLLVLGRKCRVIKGRIIIQLSVLSRRIRDHEPMVWAIELRNPSVSQVG